MEIVFNDQFQCYRVEEEGKVALIYSKTYGSDWANMAVYHRDWKRLFDPIVVSAILSRREDDFAKAMKIYDCWHEMGDLAVKWVKKGVMLKFSEYDGKDIIEEYQTMDVVTI